jgi:hypothetical protein
MNVRQLTSGTQYEVLQKFADFNGQAFARGDRLVFRDFDYFSHQDGYILYFDRPAEEDSGPSPQVVVHLKGTDQRDIVENTQRYLCAVANSQ